MSPGGGPLTRRPSMPRMYIMSLTGKDGIPRLDACADGREPGSCAWASVVFGLCEELLGPGGAVARGREERKACCAGSSAVAGHADAAGAARLAEVVMAYSFEGMESP
jgi:hypothetical protein